MDRNETNPSETNWVERGFPDRSDYPDSRKRQKTRKHKDKKSKKHKKDREERSPERSSDDDLSTKKPMLDGSSTTSAAAGSGESVLGGSSREEWMGGSESSFLFPSVSSKEIRGRAQDAKAAAKAAEAAKVAKVYRSRELNPYLQPSPSDLVNVKGCARPPTEVEVAPAVVGDGGASWLRRSYQRLQEQANDRGCSIEEVAAERWGSLDKFLSLLDEAEQKEGGRKQERRLYASSRSSGSRRDTSDRDFDRFGDTSGRETYQSVTEDRSRRAGVARSNPGERPAARPERPTLSDCSKKYAFVRPGEEVSSEWKQKDQRHQRKVASSAQSAVPQPSSSKLPQPESSSSKAFGESNHKEAASSAETLQLTETELNQMNAKILRAELMGDAATVEKLRAKIAGATKTADAASTKLPETVVLSRSHAKGFSYPVKSAPEAPFNVKPSKTATHNAAGERDRYFADDDKYSLQDLVSMERMQSAEDQNAMFARLAGKTKEKTDDEYGIDDAFAKSALKKESLDQMSLRDRDKAIMEHKQMGSALASCLYCMEGGKMPKHLVIAVGKKALLTLPPYMSLAEGHCLICPLQHVPSGTMLDEDVWEEIMAFRRALCKMFESKEMDCVFMETAMNLKSHPHMRLECVPMENEVGSMSPMYFKKAILESEGEWTQNKQLVELSKKDVRRAVPKGLPYFSVDFGMQGGYAHVIENEQRFPAYFGREIVGGMIDGEPRLWLKNLPQAFNEQLKNVKKFSAMWDPFDFTRQTEKHDT